MANEVTNPFGGKIAMTDTKELAKRAQESAQVGARGGAPDGSEYINFSGKKGVFTIGKGDKARRVDTEELWLVNPTSFEDGWVCWKKNKPLPRMANIYGAGHPVREPDPEENGPFGDQEGWFPAKGFVLKSLDNDQQVYLRLNTKSGVGEIAEFLREIAQRMGSGMPCFPVVSLDSVVFDDYNNEKPVFKIYGWLSNEAAAKLGDDPDTDIDELIASSGVEEMLSAPKGEKPAKAAPDPAPEQKEASGGRRRRRSA